MFEILEHLITVIPHYWPAANFAHCFLFILLEFPDDEIGKHITIVTEFLRSIYDTVDSSGPGIFML